MERVVNILNDLYEKADEAHKSAMAKHDWIHVNQEYGKMEVVEELLEKVTEISNKDICCEWTPTYVGSMEYQNSCNGDVEHIATLRTYCPYCGNKIKVMK